MMIILLLFSILASSAFSEKCSENSTVDLLVLCPFDSDVKIGKTTASAALVAVETLRNRNILPATFTLNVMFDDSQCSSIQTLGAILSNWKTIGGVVGPVCSGACSAGADFLNIKSLPMISWDCTQPDLSDKSNFVRTVSDYGKFSSVITAFLNNYDLQSIIMVCSVETIWITTCESLKANIESQIVNDGVKVEVKEIVPMLMPTNIEDFTDDMKDAQTFDSEVKKTFINKIKPKARVVFLACYIGAIKRILKNMGEINMLNGYLYFGMEVTPSMLTGKNRQQDSMLQGLISFNFGIASTNEKFIKFREQVYTKRDDVKVNGKKVMDMGSPEDVDSLAVNLHDAVLLFGYGLRKAIENQNESCSVRKEDLIGLQFEGRINNISIDSKGDVLNPDTLVYNFQITGDVAELREVGEVRGDKYSQVTSSTILWPGNRTEPPKECGDDGELCRGDNILPMVIGLGIFCLVIIAAASGAAFWIRRKQIQMKTAWKIGHDDICFACDRGGNALGSTTSKAMLGSKNESIGTNIGDDAVAGGVYGVIKANYKRQPVAIKYMKRQSVTVNRSIMKELNMLREMEHENVVKFHGICIETNKVCTVYTLCQKGSLQDILQNEKLNLDAMFQQSFITDILKGIEYIHKSNINYHGELNSRNILIDNHWVLKLSKFGLKTLRDKDEMFKSYTDSNDMMRKNKTQRDQLWRAPELLDTPDIGTQRGDIYSFAIVCSEILTREDPYAMYELTVEETIDLVREQSSPPYRPSIKNMVLNNIDLRDIITVCWKDNPDYRPDIGKLKMMCRELTSRQKSLTDRMILMMEKYTHHLEDMIDERTAQLQVEKGKADELLFRMLPRKVAERLKRGEPVSAEWFDEVTIYFSDIVGFTNICSNSGPLQVVDFLNDLYTTFDSVIDEYDVYKVETIGDAYMVVSGLPNRNGNEHSSEIADMALSLIEKIKTFKIRHKPDTKCLLRIGLHTGPCCAGVVGLKMPRYCLFGDTVNMASRMESNGEALRIHISPETYDHLSKRGTHIMEERGVMEIKGKGQIFTYWVNGRTSVMSNNISPHLNHSVTTHTTISSISNKEEPCTRPEDQPLLKSNSWVAPETSPLGSRPTSPIIAVELKDTSFSNGDNLSEV